ncbi:MAG: hypothetical protein ACK5JN_02905 [Kluyvera sp.]|uniref:hypothetical protein n=1 Tax=Kluyvera sp. TaxID=1538228 RepID=UPI003A8B99A1
MSETQGLVVIERLRKWLEVQLNMTAIMEPNNALARRSVRIAPAGMKMSALPSDKPGDYTPFELLLTVQMTLKLSGGNAGDFLTSQIVETGIGMNCFLLDDLMILKDIGQELPLLANDAVGKYTGTRIVGDAELTDVRRVAYHLDNNAQNDAQSAAMPVYTEVWTGVLVMTLHRYFPNPRLQKVIYKNDYSGEELIVDGTDKHIQ